jgi:hypothetical protein
MPTAVSVLRSSAGRRVPARGLATLGALALLAAPGARPAAALPAPAAPWDSGSALAAHARDSLGGRGGALRVFTDCADCTTSDFDYLRTHVTFVDHVRDPEVAEVHVLETSRAAANGGYEITLTFMGRGSYAGVCDTLRCFTNASDSEEMTLRAFTQAYKLGLVRFAARTPLAGRISVSYEEPAAAPVPRAVDRWGNWVFTASLNGWINGESSKRALNTWGSFSGSCVRRVTKTTFSVGGSYYENRFDVSDGRILSVSRGQNASARQVWGFGEHWSAAARASAYTSTYSNMKLDWAAGPSLEFNAFPYAQSTRRELRFDYHLTFHRAWYEQETIFFKTTESLLRQGVDVTLVSREPWGSASISLSGYNYLHDFSKNLLTAYGDASLRVVEGLSVKVSGNASRVRDQISLSAQGATLEEVLLAQRQLATQYQYYLSLGIQYTFGSIYSNIVNARFGS